MRDFPIFTTEYGLSSLVLKEIPYRKEAYIHIRSALEGKESEHLAECVSFCRMAGAETVFASGEHLNAYPVYASVLQMRGTAASVPEKTAQLFPVTEKTVSRWREIHNRAMAQVDNAGTLEKRDEERILKSTGAYFIHKESTLLGIGWLEDGVLLAVAALEKGAGETVMHTLMSLQEGEPITLEVASTNQRAIRLYEKLGFRITNRLIQWHRVWALPKSDGKN